MGFNSEFKGLKIVDKIEIVFLGLVDCDGSVGIVTQDGLGCPGKESRLGQNFPHPSRTALGHIQAPIQSVRGHSQG
jgi:hypothetical protein